MLWQILRLSQLPLAADPGGVTGFFQQMGERGRLGLEQSEFDVISNIVDARHQLRARRRAKRLDVAVFESHAGGGEPIEMRSLIRLPAVRRDALVTEVIGHDQHDVRLALGGAKERRKDEANDSSHERWDA